MRELAFPLDTRWRSMACEELDVASQAHRFRGPPVWRQGGRSRFRVYLAAVISPDAGERLVP